MRSFADSSTQRPSDLPQATRAAARLLVETCSTALRDRSLVVVADQKGEGTLVAAAAAVAPELVTTMLTHGRGMISVCLTAQRCRELGLHRRGGDDPRAHAQPFVTSVDAAEGVTTGISAADRTTTILAAADPQLGPESLREPGHVFVLRGREGGVAQRAGHTEAAIELAERSGSFPAAVICEILDQRGALASLEDQIEVCEQLEIPLIHIADLISVLPAGPATIVEESALELRGSQWRALRLQEGDGNLAAEHIALTRGDPIATPPVVGVVVTKPLARLLGRDDRGPDWRLPEAAASEDPTVLIALGAKRDLGRASQEVERSTLSEDDKRSVAMILQALDVWAIRRPTGIGADDLGRHGIQVVGPDL